MTLEELLAVAEIVEKLTNRYRDQEAAHKAALTEIRASCNARTSADEKIIEGLRVTAKQDQDECDVLRPLVAEARTIIDGQRASIDDLRNRLNSLGIQAAKQAGEALGMVAGEGLLGAAQRVVKERDALRAEVAALQERLRASIARGDFAQMEVARLKSQTPKHPVKVGEWVRRLTGFNTTPAGEIARVTLVDDDDASHLEYEVVRPNGQKGWWSAKGCEPCDPPEADHDTDAGKAAAESALKTEPVAEEIKVGDVVKVVGASGCLTAQSDIGKIGEVLEIDFGDGTVLLPGWAGWVNRCDVRKVPT